MLAKNGDGCIFILSSQFFFKGKEKCFFMSSTLNLGARTCYGDMEGKCMYKGQLCCLKLLCLNLCKSFFVGGQSTPLVIQIPGKLAGL